MENTMRFLIASVTRTVHFMQFLNTPQTFEMLSKIFLESEPLNATFSPNETKFIFSSHINARFTRLLNKFVILCSVLLVSICVDWHVNSGFGCCKIIDVLTHLMDVNHGLEKKLIHKMRLI